MNDSIFENLHGVVECYENGVKKWQLNNKITTLGRVALLSAMSKREFFWNPESAKDNWLSRTRWRFDAENSFISVFGIGNGGQTNDNGLPTPAKFDDKTLTQMVPFVRKEALEAGRTLVTSDKFVDIYGEWTEDGKLMNTDTLIKEQGYKLQAGGESVSEIDSFNNLYFKEVSSDSVPTAFSFANPKTSARYKTDNEQIKIKCAIARFKLEVVGGELLTTVGANGFVSINELSLYICSKYPGTARQYSYKPGVVDPESDIEYPVDGVITLPVQFSRITFPTEIFDSDSKNITFIYNIFA